MNKAKYLFLTIFFLVGPPYLSAEEPLETTSIYLGWKYQFQFAGYLAALEKGYYEAEGLDVSLHEFDTGYAPERLMEGKYDYAISAGSQILSYPNVNELLVIATIGQHSPLALITLKESGLLKLKDLEGSEVATGMEVQAMLLSAGVNMSSVVIHKRSSNMDHLRSGKFGAISRYVTDIALSRDATIEELNIFRPIDYGINFYGECLITSQKEFAKNPARVEGMRRATIKGWNYAINHPEEIIDLLVNKYDSDLTREELEKEAEIVMFSLIQPSLFQIGYSNAEKWTHMIKTTSTFRDLDEGFLIENLVYNSAEQRQNETLKSVLFYGLIFGIVTLIVFVVLIAYSSQLKKGVQTRTLELSEANKAISDTNEILESQKSELEKLNFFKVKMLSIISHDVKAPLHSIQSMIDIADENYMTMGAFKDGLRQAGLRVQEVRSFLDNTLFWANNQLDGIKLDKQTVDVLDLAKNSERLLSISAVNKKIILKNKITSNNVFVDAETIKLVFRNLLTNSIKFCSSGDTVTLSCEESDTQIKIYITDTGPGMSEEKLDQVFSSDLKSTPGSENEIGTGLGLALCKEFIELNGGEIGVESKLGKGCRFWFKLNKVE